MERIFEDFIPKQAEVLAEYSAPIPGVPETCREAPPVAPAAAALPRRRKPDAFTTITTLAAIAAAVVLGWRAMGGGWPWRSASSSEPAPELRRLSVTLPTTIHLSDAPAEVSLSPGGKLLAFTAQETGASSTSIWIRQMNSVTPRKLPGTDGGSLPFWSPDGRDIGFVAGGQLKRIPADGSGTPAIICPAQDGRGATWNRDGVIVFAPTSAGALMRVAATGGDPVAVTTLDASRQETAQRFPQFLPDGKHFLFVELPAINGQYPDQRRVTRLADAHAPAHGRRRRRLRGAGLSDLPAPRPTGRAAPGRDNARVAGRAPPARRLRGQPRLLQRQPGGNRF